MKLHRVLAITRKQFLTLRHEPRSIGLILVAPIMAMLVFGFAFGSEVEHVPVVVVNHDAAGDEGEAAAIIAQMDRVALDVRETRFDTDARDSVRGTSAVAAIIFPENFTEAVTPQAGAPAQPGPGGLPVGATGPTPPRPPNGTSIEVLLDGTNSQRAAVVQRELAAAMQAWAEARGASSPVQVDVTAAYAEDARFIDFFVPGIMAFAALMLTTILTLLAFIGERTQGTLDRLRVTPATEGEIVAGNVLAFGIIGAVQGVFLISAALLVFDVLVVGSVLLAALIVILVAVDSQAIGVLLSSLAQRESQAVMMLPFIIFPTFLLSGIFVPVETLPGWLRPFAYLLPPTWAVEALRNVMLRGFGLGEVAKHLLVLVGFAVAFTLASVVALKRARA